MSYSDLKVLSFIVYVLRFFQMPELTLEQLYTQLNTVGTKVDDYIASQKKAMTEKEKEKEAAKKAMDDKKEHEEAKKAKLAKFEAAMKKAMDETDDEKKDAAIKKAMHDYDDDHKAMHDDDKDHKAMTDEEKEEKASVASILGDKKEEIRMKILTANKLINPLGLKDVEARIKTASFTDLQKEWKTIEPFVGSTVGQQSAEVPQEKVIPPMFSAAMLNPEVTDLNQLNASSPVESFANFSTKELLEMNQ